MTEKDKVAISVRNVAKEFKVYYTPGPNGANSASRRGLSSLLGKQSRYRKIEVLKDVSFDIMRGEMVGILGVNGAGKSTLLKIIAGIIQPTRGTVKVNGKITSLLGFGGGFNKKLTARENIIQHGLILGLSKQEVTERVDDVLEFAELEKFADDHVSHFSSGMTARLAFSTTLLINPDILLMDEALAVGDYFFHQKSAEAFQRIRKKSGAIVFISHSLGSIRKNCDRAMLLNEGKIEVIGDPDTVIRRYLELGLNEKDNTSTAQLGDEVDGDSDTIKLDSANTPETAKDDSGESKAVATSKVAASAVIEAPTNLFPDGSPFLEGMLKIPSKRLRWRGKVLIEKSSIAIKDKSVLDLRCQNGQFVYAALQAGAKYVEGIEKQHELVEIARENLATYYGGNAENNRYRINEGSLLRVLRTIKPNTFDTVFCFGIMNKLINNAGLMQQIARINPTYLMIDVNVSEASEPVMEFDAADNEDSGTKNEEDIKTDGRNVSLPSRSAIELILRTYKFKFEYIDWNKAGIVDWTGLEEYQNGQRVSIIASTL